MCINTAETKFDTFINEKLPKKWSFGKIVSLKITVVISTWVYMCPT